MGGSAELSAAHLRGDLLAALAGLLYTGYLIFVERTRGRACAAAPAVPRQPVRRGHAASRRARCRASGSFPPTGPRLFALALCSQVIGQGLLVYALGHVPPLVVGIAMLTQPALSALLGWLYYGEALTPLDWVGRDADRRSRWSWSACASRAAKRPVKRHGRRPPRSRRLRRRLALAVGENAVFDGWTREGGRQRRGAARDRPGAGAARLSQGPGAT